MGLKRASLGFRNLPKKTYFTRNCKPLTFNACPFTPRHALELSLQQSYNKQVAFNNYGKSLSVIAHTTLTGGSFLRLLQMLNFSIQYIVFCQGHIVPLVLLIYKLPSGQPNDWCLCYFNYCIELGIYGRPYIVFVIPYKSNL